MNELRIPLRFGLKTIFKLFFEISKIKSKPFFGNVMKFLHSYGDGRGYEYGHE